MEQVSTWTARGPEWPALPGKDTEGGINFDAIVASLAEFANVASIMRLSGAALVVAAISSFLLQSWGAGSDIDRYYKLLMQTLLLAGGGFALSFGLKETQGGRVFFGLSLVSTVANAATLGALIYSLIQLFGTLPSDAPHFALWTAASPAATGIAAIASLIVLAPIAYFSFAVMARQSARRLTGLFLYTCLLLLLPVRETGLIGLVFFAGLVPLLLSIKTLKADPARQTVEGLFAFAMPFVPMAILAVRSFMLYDFDLGLQLILSLGGFAMLRQTSVEFAENSVVRRAMNLSALGLAAVASVTLIRLIPLEEPALLLVGGAVNALLAFDIAYRSGRKSKIYGYAAVSLLTGGLMAAIVSDALVYQLALIGIGLVMIPIGKRIEMRTIVRLGVITALGATGNQLRYLIEYIELGNWVALSLLGGGIIVVGSLVERHGTVIKAKLQNYLN